MTNALHVWITKNDKLSQTQYAYPVMDLLIYVY